MSPPPPPSADASDAEPALGADSLLPDPSVWQTLFSSQRRVADEKRALERLLVTWSDAHGGCDAALYTRTDQDGWVRAAKVGKTAFPEHLPADPTEDERSGGWRRMELPGALLVHDSDALDAEAEPPTTPAHLLLAASTLIGQLKRQIQEQSFQAMFRGVELEALYEVGLAIASTLDYEGLGEEVLLRAISLLDARRGALYLLESESDHYELSSSLGGDARESIERSEVHAEALSEGDGAAGVPEDLLPGADHLLAVPVEIEGRPRGLLVVADKESRTGVGPFPPTDRRTLALFANQAAIALENAKLHKLALEKERLEREMELAAEIQQQLLPDEMPEIPGYDVIGWNRPARQVGGDYFEFDELPDGRWTLTVGDVTGKGMPASLLVSTLHSALRVLLDHMEADPALLVRLNRHIYESSASNKFITLLLVALEPASGRLRSLNAGHNPGVLLRHSGENTVGEKTVELGAGGLPLGLLPGGDYQAEELEIGPGDLLCLYSDGITECERPDEEQFDLPRLVDLLRQHADEPLDEIIRVIDRTMLDWAAGLPQGDDQTVVLLRRHAARENLSVKEESGQDARAPE